MMGSYFIREGNELLMDGLGKFKRLLEEEASLYCAHVLCVELCVCYLYRLEGGEHSRLGFIAFLILFLFFATAAAVCFTLLFSLFFSFFFFFFFRYQGLL